jgi:hypothetical protein
VYTVVVARREVHDGVMAALVRLRVLGAPEERRDVVGLALHQETRVAVDGAVVVEATVGGRDDDIRAVVDDVHALTQPPREELVEAREPLRRNHRLVEVDRVRAGVHSEHGVEEKLRHVCHGHATHETRDALPGQHVEDLRGGT